MLEVFAQPVLASRVVAHEAVKSRRQWPAADCTPIAAESCTRKPENL